MPELEGASQAETSPVPVAPGITLLLVPEKEGEISILVEKFNKRAEFVQYVLTDERGGRRLTGAIAEGRTIRFRGEENRHYFLHVSCRASSGIFKVSGASVAYRLIGKRGLILDGDFLERSSALYFPSGQRLGQLDNRVDPSAYLSVYRKDFGSGSRKTSLDQFFMKF